MTAETSSVGPPVAGQVADCRVWWADPAHAPDWCEELLSESERTRAEFFHQVAQRRRFTVATALLKIVVAESTGRDPFEVTLRRQCPECGRSHGRPQVVEGTPHVSISHSGDRVAVALCADGPVGVDVEQVNPTVDLESMARFALGDAELQAFDEIPGRQDRVRAFFRCWTRKESVLKATGDGLRIPMANLTLAALHAPARLVGFTSHPELVEMAQLLDLHPGAGYVAAVTVLSARPLRVRELDGTAALATAAELVRDRW